MDYKQTIEYLFNSAPMFQNVGKAAYKEGLANTFALDEYFGHPHQKYRTIHVAGTNGKGSCSHTIASVLQSAGYRVGLFTSPHLIDFRERIRVNGKMMSEQYVIDFVAKHRSFFEPLYPSFFELTTAMAFKYFEDEKVDFAVIEVGLGGRLDCTNIISPLLSIITNISFDHVLFLGDTLAKIAAEKAGIIKTSTPVVIGETTAETRPVFEEKAKLVGAEIVFAEENKLLSDYSFNTDGSITYQDTPVGTLTSQLGGFCQTKNTNTLLNAFCVLRKIDGVNITDDAIRLGFSNVCGITGLMGRWQTIQTEPKVVCDTGHNTGGFQYICNQLVQQKCSNLRIVIGMVNDKDISGVLKMLPQQAIYYFTQASVNRALPAEDVARLANDYKLKGATYPSVCEAYAAALNDAEPTDFIYVGGSTFIVADLLTYLSSEKLSALPSV